MTPVMRVSILRCPPLELLAFYFGADEATSSLAQLCTFAPIDPAVLHI